MLNAWRSSAFSLTSAALLGALAACRSEPVGPSEHSLLQTRPHYDDYTSETGGEECPPNVPLSECQPITQAERDQIYWDILFGVHWNNEECNRVGQRALDMAQYGDIRKYPMMSSYYLGYWRRQSELGTERIAFRADRLLTYGDRMSTMTHESSHSRWNRGDHGFTLYDPYWVQDNCFDN